MSLSGPEDGNIIKPSWWVDEDERREQLKDLKESEDELLGEVKAVG